MPPRAPVGAARLRLVLGSLLLVLAGVGLAAASLGAGRLSLLALWQSVSADERIARTILLDVRLPRVALAGLLGGALTVAGLVFQALLRNPLADPYILGVAGGASIGGVLALVLGPATWLYGAGLPAAAFCGALAALLLIERIATVGGRLTVYTVLLTGAIFNAFSAAVIYLLQSMASLDQLHSIVFYLMGRIPSLGWHSIGAIAVPIVAAVLLLAARARDYNVLTLGEEGAAYLGVDVERLKRQTFVVGSLLTALTVSVAGMIGFVGLIVPHLLRLLFGPDHRLLIPAGFLGGASFLILADLVSRTLISPDELPVGVVTALVGGPFFLYLLRRRGRGRVFD
ncbi:MAG TPA: iron ABC transporter permease [Candidatus Polarisedimenticolaceae bacterium]|nr:iron ABC transporter permease [Candidatus Polarisedimenticolaceae bacterium]